MKRYTSQSQSQSHSHIHTVTQVLKRCVDYIHLHFIYWILSVQGNLNLNELLFDIVCAVTGCWFYLLFFSSIFFVPPARHLDRLQLIRSFQWLCVVRMHCNDMCSIGVIVYVNKFPCCIVFYGVRRYVLRGKTEQKSIPIEERQINTKTININDELNELKQLYRLQQQHTITIQFAT